MLAAAVLTAVTASSVQAADGDTDLSREQLGAEVTVGYGRGPDSARWSPVEVTFSPQVPVAGDLAVRVNGSVGSGLETATVEVAAGATKVVHLLAPPGEELAVRFTPRDGDPVDLAAPGRLASGDVYVGGFDEAPALPETLASTGSDRAIRAVAVDGALFDLGPRTLEALDAVVLPAADLAALTDPQRAAIEVAVAQGLDLVVPVRDGDADLAVRWDPVETVAGSGADAAITPGPDTWSATGDELGTAGGEHTVVAASPAGDGRVVAVAAEPGASGLGSDAALWGAILQPRSDPGQPFAGADQGRFAAGLFGSDLAVPGSLGFALFVLAFVVVVGPVNALALRRWGRRELAWVTVPAITVVFTLVAVGSAAARAPTTSPLVRAAWWLDGVGEELTAVALQSPSRGVATVDLPAGHDALVAEPWSGLVGAVARSADLTRIGVPLEALQTATVVSWGPAAAPPPLEVTATFVDGHVEVALTNQAATTLTDVVIHLATSEVPVDDLPAGGTATITTDELEDTLPRSRWADVDRMMGGMGVPGAARQPDATAGLALLRGAVLDDTPGPVWVTAVLADDPTGTVPRVAGTIDDRGTVVAVGVTPERASGAVTPFEVQRQLLRTGAMGWRPGPLVVEGAEELLVRFRLPPGAPSGDLISTLDTGGPVNGGGMGMPMPAEPWGGGCWEVTEIDPEGNSSEPEERCGDDVACPSDRGDTTCSEDGAGVVEACFGDGSCQIAERIGDWSDADPEGDIPFDTMGGPVPDLPVVRQGGGNGERDLAGVEVFDREAGTFVPAAEAFTEGTGDADQLVSPLGEVLLRIRGGSMVDLARRGLGVGGDA